MEHQTTMDPELAAMATRVRENLQRCLDAHPELYGLSIDRLDVIGIRSFGGIEPVTQDESGNVLSGVPDRNSVFISNIYDDRWDENADELTVHGRMDDIELPREWRNVSVRFTLYRSGLYRVQYVKPTAKKASIDSLLTITVPKRFRDRQTRLAGDLPPLPPTPEPEPPRVATAALTDARAENDLQIIEDLLRKAPATGGFSEADIRAAEKQRGVKFPEELRLFFSQVSQGVILDTAGDLDDDEYDALFDGDAEVPWYAEVHSGGLLAGTGELGNVVDPAARCFGEVEDLVLPKPSEDDVVQPVFASPLWIVFADDGGGNSYALDLAPGPKGKIGQIVQFDHETFDPPQRVAESLTDFLQGNCIDPSGVLMLESANPDTAFVDVHAEDVSSRTIPTHLRHCLRRIALWQMPKDADLTELRSFPHLKTVTLCEDFRPEEMDMSALRSLSQVTKLEAPKEIVDYLITEDAFPPNLKKFTINTSTLNPDIDELKAANRMRQHMGLKPHNIQTWEFAHPNEPLG